MSLARKIRSDASTASLEEGSVDTEAEVAEFSPVADLGGDEPGCDSRAQDGEPIEDLAADPPPEAVKPSDSVLAHSASLR